MLDVAPATMSKYKNLALNGVVCLLQMSRCAIISLRLRALVPVLASTFALETLHCICKSLVILGKPISTKQLTSAMMMGGSTEESPEEQNNVYDTTSQNQEIFRSDDKDDVEASNSEDDKPTNPHDTTTDSFSDAESCSSDEEGKPQSKLVYCVGCIVTIVLLGAVAAGLLVVFTKDAGTSNPKHTQSQQQPTPSPTVVVLAPLPTLGVASSDPTHGPTPEPTPGPSPGPSVAAVPTGTPAPATGWLQQGADIVGGTGDSAAWSVDFSEDGTTIAVGSWADAATGDTAGNAKVYRYDSDTWTQLGGDIVGENEGDFSGWSISLSGNGNILAIGGHGSDGDGGKAEDAGHVRVFEWTESEWTLLGKVIYGKDPRDLCGWSVSLSSDGLSLVVGSPRHETDVGAVGQARVFEYDGKEWKQVGADLVGSNADDEFGHSVSLNADGSHVAVGVPGGDALGSRTGHVQVFFLDNKQWATRGSPVVGFAAGDGFGHSISLVGNATEPNTVAVGAPNANSGAGETRIYVWIGIAWAQLGDPIIGDTEDDNSGSSVSLAADARTLAVGAPGHENDTGRADLHRWDGRFWPSFGALNGSKSGDSFGRSVSIASSGLQVAAVTKDDLENLRVVQVFALTFSTYAPIP